MQLTGSPINPFGLFDVLRGILDGRPLDGEDALKERLAGCLTTSRRELRMHFHPAAVPSDPPPKSAISFCRSYESEKYPDGIELPANGWDACMSKRPLGDGSFAPAKRRLDILWDREGQHIALELKYRAKWTGDTYGYDFLKDLHRLERLREAEDRHSGTRRGPTPIRVAIFVSAISNYWTGQKEPETFHLKGFREGRCAMVQYPKHRKRPLGPTSPLTLWHVYVPFYLVNDYTFTWQEVGDGLHRALVVPVKRQEYPACERSAKPKQPRLP